MPLQSQHLVLASASPRRRLILEQLGLQFRIEVSHTEEPPPAPGQRPVEYAEALAAAKAEAVAKRRGDHSADAFVLAADTIVLLGGLVLGKPADDDEAVAMLEALAGREHVVVTAVALRGGAADVQAGLAVHTRVRFRAFDVETARRYVASGEGRDKAGSYAIQGLGAGLVAAIDGSYSNVVGLPAVETLDLLERAGAVESWP